jgi:ATP-dependent Clp protease ATP-binding subunit ClpC
MFERFTDEARRAVVSAQEEARSLGHDYIGTEHLLLGLLHDGQGPAAAALDALHVTSAAVRGRVEQIVGRGPRVTADRIPFTPRAKKVLELSLRESLQLGDDHIGSEHLLLGLIREGEGVAVLALEQEGVELEQLRAELAAHLPTRDPHTRGRRWLRRERQRGRQAGGTTPAGAPSVFERLDDAAWETMLAARRSARARSAAAVAVRDVLIGIATASGPGAAALAAAGLDAAAVGAAGEPAPDPGDPAAPMFSAAVRERLRWAVDDADRRGHPVAGTGHLLLALLTTPDVELDQLLTAAGVDRGDLHAEAARVLAEDLGRPGGRPSHGA